MKKKIVLVISFLLAIGALFTGCSSNKSTNVSQTDSQKEAQAEVATEKTLRIGTSPVTTKIVESAVPSLEKMGYKIEVVPFDDFVLPNVALTEGSIDANIFQHTAYLDQYNKNNNTNLKMIDEIALSLVGFYSNKFESVDSIPEKAKIGIYQDASNQDRALRMLEEVGLITLKEKDGLYSLLDIENNLKNIELITMDINQLVKGIEDLDASFVTGPNLVLSGVEPKYTLSIENAGEEAKIYAVGLVVAEENENKEWIKDVLEAYETKETEDALNEAFKGTFKIVLE